MRIALVTSAVAAHQYSAGFTAAKLSSSAHDQQRLHRVGDDAQAQPAQLHRRHGGDHHHQAERPDQLAR